MTGKPIHEAVGGALGAGLNLGIGQAPYPPV